MELSGGVLHIMDYTEAPFERGPFFGLEVYKKVRKTCHFSYLVQVY